MTRTLTFLAFLLLASPNALAASAPPDPSSDFGSAFERLQTLVGTWDVEDTDRSVVYYLTGNDRTLVEDFRGEPTMASFYHRDGDALRLTHYCNAGNQPRMKAVAYDAAKGVLKFEFVDVTNLSAPMAYYTRDLEIRFLGEDHVELEFTGTKNGKTLPGGVMTLRRRRIK